MGDGGREPPADQLRGADGPLAGGPASACRGAAELEAAEARQADEEEPEEGEEADREDGDQAERPSRRRRGRRGGRRGRSRATSVLEATFDHGEEGYGLWLDPSVQDDPIYAEYWAGHRPVEVTIDEDQIVIRRVGGEEADEGE